MGPKGLEDLEDVIFECALMNRGSGTRGADLFSDFFCVRRLDSESVTVRLNRNRHTGVDIT